MRFRLQPSALILTHCPLRHGSTSTSKFAIATFATIAHSPSTLPPTWKQDLDAHNYTSGRWLINNKQEQALRIINFDFNALCGFNRAFKFTFDNDKRLVAKLPFKVAGPPQLTTASEVATVKYLQQKTKIPTPEIIDWSSDAANHVGSEYIIMEHMAGSSVWDKWSSMTITQRIKFINAVYDHLKLLPKLDFPVYGSIYFDNEDMDPSLSTKSIEDGFCIGPHCGREWWDRGLGKFHNHHKQVIREPWTDMLAYSNAIIDLGLAKLPATDPDPSTLEKPLPFYQGSVKTHLELLEHARTLLAKMSNDMKIKLRSTPTLFHPDIQKQRIFVSDEDPTVITGFIGWQYTAIEPAFCYAHSTPNFVSQTTSTAVPSGAVEESASKKPVQEETSSTECDTDTKIYSNTIESTTEAEEEAEKESKLQALQQVEQEHYTRMFDICLTYKIPQLGICNATHVNTFRPFHISASTWSNGIIKLQHELLQLRKEWKWLGFSGECPYPKQSPEFEVEHSKRYDVYKDVLEIRSMLANLLAVDFGDGWGFPENWDLRERAHKELYLEFLRAVKSECEEGNIIRSEEDVRSVWPFDIPV